MRAQVHVGRVEESVGQALGHHGPRMVSQWPGPWETGSGMQTVGRSLKTKHQSNHSPCTPAPPAHAPRLTARTSLPPLLLLH